MYLLSLPRKKHLIAKSTGYVPGINHLKKLALVLVTQNLYKSNVYKKKSYSSALEFYLVNIKKTIGKRKHT